jgi:predicted nucleic acid-binding protein
MVIDASAALFLTSMEDGFRQVEATLIAPALLWSEVISTIRRGVWRGAASPALADEMLDRLLTARIGRRSGDELYRRATDVATSLGWARTYDAEYVALAQLEDRPLLTADHRLGRRVASFVEIVDPADVVR